MAPIIAGTRSRRRDRRNRRLENMRQRRGAKICRNPPSGAQRASADRPMLPKDWKSRVVFQDLCYRRVERKRWLILAI
jgi:hypothetical protein